MKAVLFFLPFLLNAAIFKEMPENFKPKFEIVGSFIEVDGKILLLHRQDHKEQGNTWAIPGGKIDKGETPVDASIRETFEETGYLLDTVDYLGFVYIKYEKYDFIYHMTMAKPEVDPSKVSINFKESKGFTWMTPFQALDMNLMPDEGDCFKLIYKL
ncbi:MAG: NUDIX hydrolase [Parachlamydiaceae bacterium]